MGKKLKIKVTSLESQRNLFTGTETEVSLDHVQMENRHAVKALIYTTLRISVNLLFWAKMSSFFLTHFSHTHFSVTTLCLAIPFSFSLQSHNDVPKEALGDEYAASGPSLSSPILALLNSVLGLKHCHFRF